MTTRSWWSSAQSIPTNSIRLLRVDVLAPELRENGRDLMDSAQGTTSHQRSWLSRSAGRGTLCQENSTFRLRKCSPADSSTQQHAPCRKPLAAPPLGSDPLCIDDQQPRVRLRVQVP